jgi:hypothetical protein
LLSKLAVGLGLLVALQVRAVLRDLLLVKGALVVERLAQIGVGKPSLNVCRVVRETGVKRARGQVGGEAKALGDEAINVGQRVALGVAVEAAV